MPAFLPLEALAAQAHKHFYGAPAEVTGDTDLALQRLFAANHMRKGQSLNLLADPASSGEGGGAASCLVLGDLQQPDGSDDHDSESPGPSTPPASGHSDHKSSAPVWSSWEVYENHDAFPGEHATTKPFTSAEEAMKLCSTHAYSGFVVFVTGGALMAHFRRQHRSELREKRIRSKGAVLYVGPPATKRRLSSAAQLKMGKGKVSSPVASTAASTAAASGETPQSSPTSLRTSDAVPSLVLVAVAGMPPGATLAEIAKKETLRVKVEVRPLDEALDDDALDPVKAMGFTADKGSPMGSPRAQGSGKKPAFFGAKSSGGGVKGSPTGSGRGSGGRRVVSWRWRSHDGEVGVSALFFPTPQASSSKGPPQAIVAPFVRGRDGGGEWTVSGEGTVVFEMDNSDAAHLGRTVEYAIATHDLPGATD
jgi:hypothetical protein